MKKRMAILILVVLVVELLTGCGVSMAEFQNLAGRVEVLELEKETQTEPETTISVAEFQELMARVQTLEEMNQAEETEIQEKDTEELT